MKKQKTKAVEPLRLEIQADGSRAGLYEGRLLVVGFEWSDSVNGFNLSGVNDRWFKLITENKAFRYYLDGVIKVLEDYRGEALKVAAMKLASETAMSGFLFVGD